MGRYLENLFHDITATDEQCQLTVFAGGMLSGKALANFPLHGDDQPLGPFWHRGQIDEQRRGNVVR